MTRYQKSRIGLGTPRTKNELRRRAGNERKQQHERGRRKKRGSFISRKNMMHLRGIREKKRKRKLLKIRKVLISMSVL